MLDAPRAIAAVRRQRRVCRRKGRCAELLLLLVLLLRLRAIIMRQPGRTQALHGGKRGDGVARRARRWML